MQHAINEDDLIESVCSIWSLTLGLDVTPSKQISDNLSEETIASEVHIVGRWNGVVSLVASDRLARQAARSLFGLTDQEPDDEQIFAALMELVNMTGGNIKGRFDVQSVLSVPRAKRQVGYKSHGVMATEDRCTAFSSEFGPFVVCVLKSEIQTIDDILNA